MDPRRVPRTVSDPKVRQVGFFAPPDRSLSGPPDPTSSSPPVSNISPSGNSLSSFMILPPRHLSADLNLQFPHPPPPLSPLRAARADDYSIPVGSYNPSEFSSPSGITDFPDNSGKFAMSLPSGGFGMATAKQSNAANVADGIDFIVEKMEGEMWKCTRRRGQLVGSR